MNFGSTAYIDAWTDTKQLASLRDAVRRWLLSDTVQIADGEQRGAIAGLIDASGKPEFVYGEITGYWLRWCSLYAPDAHKMRAAVEWAYGQWKGSAPGKTRVGHSEDWRNRAVFSFDLGMMLQGLADAAPIVGVDLCRTVAARMSPWLDRMATEDGLAPLVALTDEALPTRWSTQAGPFQIKTAACILGTPDDWLSKEVRDAAKRTFQRWKDTVNGHNELHARCYSIEGGLRLNAPVPSTAVTNLPVKGGALPEYEDQPNSGPRSDVQAQALRLHCVLGAPAPERLAAITAVLLPHIAEDGSVRFDLKRETRNVWCAMFAHQALDWLSGRLGDQFVRPAAASDLI